MGFAATPFADLPIAEDAQWDPDEEGTTEILNEVLGDNDWERYEKAHLAWDSEHGEAKAGYKLPIARMIDGKLSVVMGQLGQAVGAINGSRAPIDLPDDVRRKAYDHAMQYYKKAGIDEDKRPAFQATKASKLAGGKGKPIQLAKDEQGDDGARWQHVATEGDYLGYRGGTQPFAFTRELFGDLQKNFRNHPSFKAGEDGVGSEPVIPWDFEHASTQESSEGMIPVLGAPAQGWALDLDIRTGADGTAQLWALTEWNELAREYIKTGQYRWASVVVFKNWVDIKSGRPVGAWLNSIALTNTPVLEGMEPLAASKPGLGKGDAIEARHHYFEAANTAAEAVEQMRSLFNLPSLTGSNMVASEIAKLRGWLETGATPMGVDINDIMGALRQILGMATLSEEMEVIAAAEEITRRLIAEQAVQSGAAAAPAVDMGNMGAADDPSQLNTGGDEMELLKQLAELFGVRENEETVLSAAKEASALRVEASKALGTDRDNNDTILASTKKAHEDAVQLSALHEALGVTTSVEAAKKVTDYIAASKELDELKPKLAEMEKERDDRTKAEAEKEVDAVIAAHKLPEQTKRALLASRLADPDQFAKDFPPLNEEQAALVQPVVASQTPSAQPSEGDAQVIQLSSYPGLNDVDRAQKHIVATVKGADTWSYDDLHKAACIWLREQKAATQ